MTKKIIAILILFAAPTFAGFSGGADKNKVNLTTDQTVCGNKTFCSSQTIFNGKVGISTTAIPTEALVVDGNEVVTGSVTAKKYFGDGSNLTGIAPGGLILPYVSTDTTLRIGTLDPFARHQIQYTGASAMLRMGASAVDGDPLGDIDAEGFVAYKPSVNRQITLQPEDMRLTEADWSKYFFISNPDLTAVSSLDHTRDLFSVTAASSVTYVNGFLRYTDGSEGVGKVLKSDGLGNASWQTESDPVFAAALPGLVTYDLATQKVMIGTTTSIGGSNAGIQYNSTITNRGQIRMNQFGNNTGIAGLTGFKSRGANVGDMASVAAGDVLVRLTGIGVPTNNTSLFLSGLFSLVVATSGPTAAQVPSYWEWNSTDFSGVSGVVMKTTPDGGLWVKSEVTATKYYGDGSALTGLVAGGDVFKASTQTLTGINTLSNAANVFYGDGTNLTGVLHSYSETDPVYAAAASGLAKLASTQTFTGGNTFSNNVVMSAAEISFSANKGLIFPQAYIKNDLSGAAIEMGTNGFGQTFRLATNGYVKIGGGLSATVPLEVNGGGKFVSSVTANTFTIKNGTKLTTFAISASQDDSPHTYTWPEAALNQGGKFLKTENDGVLSWANPLTGAALLASTQTFTGANTFRNTLNVTEPGYAGYIRLNSGGGGSTTGVSLGAFGVNYTCSGGGCGPNGLTLDSVGPITLSPNSYPYITIATDGGLTSVSSITANTFYGDGTNLTLGWERVVNACGPALTCAATCSGAKKLMGGGCSTGNATTLNDSGPSADNVYTCNTSVTVNLTATALCISTP